MAHPNIDERRAFVVDLLNKGIKIDFQKAKDIAKKFDCHHSAIYADMRHFRKSAYRYNPDVGSLESSTRNKYNLPELQNEQQRIEAEGYFDTKNIEDARRRVTSSIVQRQGQSEFRRKLLIAYNARCPISGCDAEAAIEAAHILPYQGIQTNHVTNGLPLRADIHTLFDLYLISIKPETYTVVIAPNLSETYYQNFAGKKLNLPVDIASFPNREAIKEHYNNFLQKHGLE